VIHGGGFWILLFVNTSRVVLVPLKHNSGQIHLIKDSEKQESSVNLNSMTASCFVVAEAVFFSNQARVQSQANLCQICGGWNGIRTDFSLGCFSFLTSVI
jgi:hypothetical protein